MVVKLVAGLERRLQGRALLAAGVLQQEDPHACNPPEVALIVPKRNRHPNHALRVVDLDVLGHVVERRQIELLVELGRFVEGHRGT
ncbi:MAG: hypothetical protein WBN29_09640, partial [Polyangiales bacterium]